jgi:hypothetical protein
MEMVEAIYALVSGLWVKRMAFSSGLWVKRKAFWGEM